MGEGIVIAKTSAKTDVGGRAHILLGDGRCSRWVKTGQVRGEHSLMRCGHDEIGFVDPAVMPFPGLIQLHDCGRASVRITNHS